jgi:hypothetical protein
MNGVVCSECGRPATHREEVLAPSIVIRLNGSKLHGPPAWRPAGYWCDQHTGIRRG